MVNLDILSYIQQIKNILILNENKKYKKCTIEIVSWSRNINTKL